VSVVVEVASRDDAAAILVLAGLSASTRRSLARDLTGGGTCCLVARRDGAVVGFAAGLLQHDEGHVLDLVVARGQRREGIATHLLAALERCLRRRGAVAITLEVRAHNEPARALYRRSGYVEDGRRPRYYPDGEDAVLMWRRETR
jgi:[ribosomal protein S18]-alanine N-acetyltransferase